MWKAPEYKTWAKIKQRCHNPKDANYFRYGARGIAMCPKWRNNFEAFFADVGLRPSPSHSLDRFPNNDGGYEPGNVRWATITEQANNKRYGIWKRIVLLLAGDDAAEIAAMVDDHRPDVEVAAWIARCFLPRAEAAA
jgi:hypothetical protein